jgi:predicted dehydrogenase
MLYWLDVWDSLGKWGWRDFKADAGGGWILDGGVHFADLFRYHIGEAKTCAAFCHSYEPFRYDKSETRENPIPVTVEDTALAMLQFENDILAEWTSCKAAPGRGFNTRVVYGSEGALDWSQGFLPRQGDPVDFKALGEEFRAALSEEEKERLFPRGVTDTVATELLEYVRAVRGQAKCEVDGVEGYKDEALCFAVYESAAQGGQPVSVAAVENCEIELYQKDLNEKAGLA